MDVPAYKIARWRELYEVDDKGKQAKPDAVLRQSPLDYVRFQVHGRSMGASYRRLQTICGTQARFESTFAVWAKLLELAGCETAGRRGQILNERGSPATAKDIAFFTGFRESSVAFALKALSHDDVGWIEIDSGELPDSPGNSPELPDSPGILRNPSRTKPNPNPNRNTTESNETEDGEDRKELEASSGSDSRKPISRPAALIEYSEAITPLIGSNGRGKGKYPRGSAQYEGDVTSTGNWFRRRIWPHDDPDEAACRARFREFMSWLDAAGGKGKPLAWLTSRIQKWHER